MKQLYKPVHVLATAWACKQKKGPPSIHGRPHCGVLHSQDAPEQTLNQYVEQDPLMATNDISLRRH